MENQSRGWFRLSARRSALQLSFVHPSFVLFPLLCCFVCLCVVQLHILVVLSVFQSLCDFVFASLSIRLVSGSDSCVFGRCSSLCGRFVYFCA